MFSPVLAMEKEEKKEEKEKEEDKLRKRNKGKEREEEEEDEAEERKLEPSISSLPLRTSQGITRRVERGGEKNKRRSEREDEKEDKEGEKALIEVPEEEGSHVREVSVYMHVRDVVSVDTVENTVKLDFTVTLTWIDEKLKGKKEKEIKWEEQWDPDVEVYNARELDVQESIDLKDKKKGLVRKKIRYVGSLSNWMNLHNFPFDHEDVLILVRPRLYSSKAVLFKIDPSWRSEKALGSSTAIGLPEFEIGTPIVKVHEFPRHTSSANFSAAILMIPFRRISGFYLWRVFLILLFMTVMSWVTFTMDAFADRMNIVVTLFLSTVAFLFAIADNLPKVPYLTFLDKLVTLSFVWLFSTAVENFIVSLIQNDYSNVAQIIDYVSLAIFPIGYFAAILIMYLLMSRDERVTKFRLNAHFPSQSGIFPGRKKDIEKMMVESLKNE